MITKLQKNKIVSPQLICSSRKQTRQFVIDRDKENASSSEKSMYCEKIRRDVEDVLKDASRGLSAKPERQLLGMQPITVIEKKLLAR